MKKRLLLVLLLTLQLFVIVGCDKKENNNNNTKEEVKNIEQTGNKTLKEDLEEAEYQIKVAMQKLLEEAYGDEVIDARIYVVKMYTKEDEEKNEALKERKLSSNEMAFEVKYELKVKDGVDPIKFTAANGEYDEESGWVKEKYNLGILRPDGDSYKITDFGTGW